MRAFALTLAALMMVACAEDAAVDSAAAGGSGLGGKLDEGAANDVVVASDTAMTSDTAMGDTAVIEGDTVATEDSAEPIDDMWSMARDITVHRIVFPEGSPVPESYDYPNSSGAPFSLGGTEFWQKWSGGENPTYSFYNGSDNGKRCMYASARRWEAIMAVVPDALVELREQSNWSGSFFNWNDDYSNDSWGDGNGARLWAWRTSLVKWISQTNNDGSCYLPTIQMVEALVVDCMSKAENSDGEIQGCSANEPNPLSD
jgi:hypothetical protein